MYFAMELYNSNNWADDVGRAAFENKFYNNWATSRSPRELWSIRVQTMKKSL